MDLEVVVFDSVAQVVFEAESIEGARVHVGIEQLMSCLAARFGVIHGGVGVAHDLLGVNVLGAAERNPDARRGEDFPASNRKRPAQRLLDAECDGVGLRLVIEPVQEDRELVAAEPGQGISRPQTGFEPPRYGRQELVADEVAQAVVDDLEAIEIEVQSREPAAAVFLEFLEPASKQLHEHGAVAKAG